MQPALIETAFRGACEDELQALKPGNVHVHAPGHRMTVEDFRASAEAAAPALCRPGARLGERVLAAVAATRERVGQNTNLGIILLCAPLALAAACQRPGTALRAELVGVLTAADLADARAVFRAIALAQPGGLGEAPAHDVRQPATATLAVAMAAAAGRDSIARQWTTGFADVFDTGSAVLARATTAGWCGPRATIAVYLEFLSAFPDSHVARRHGIALAEAVAREAQIMQRRFWAAPTWADARPMLAAWDAALKRRAVNPGTSADLTVATLFARKLTILRAERDGD